MYVNIFFSTGSWNAQIQGISIFPSDAFCLSFDSIGDISVLKSAARKKENICNSNCRDVACDFWYVRRERNPDDKVTRVVILEKYVGLQSYLQ